MCNSNLSTEEVKEVLSDWGRQQRKQRDTHTKGVSITHMLCQRLKNNTTSCYASSAQTDNYFVEAIDLVVSQLTTGQRRAIALEYTENRRMPAWRKRNRDRLHAFYLNAGITRLTEKL